MTTDVAEPKPNTRHRLRWAALVTIAAVATATAGGVWWARARVVPVGDVHVLIAPAELDVFAQAHPQEAFEGDLVTSGRCLVLRGPDGTERALVWPHGTDATGTADEVRVTHDDVTVSTGARATVGATEERRRSTLTDMFGSSLPADCAGPWLRVHALLG